MSDISNLVMKEGVKGSDVYETTGSQLLDLSVMLVRGLSAEKLEAGMTLILDGRRAGLLEDLCVLLFQTRNIRGGKGERTLAYEMLKVLQQKESSLALKLLSLFPHYGCWRDLFKLAENVVFTGAVINMTVEQIAKDRLALSSEPKGKGG